MTTARERREADLFYADLFGLPRPPVPRFSEEAGGWTNYRSGRVVFYDRETLRFIEGWTRYTGTDRVFLINRSDYDSVRDDGRRRSREEDDYLRRRLQVGAPGNTNNDLPLFIIDPALYTAPLNPRSSDWDDLMIDLLIDRSRPLSIESQQVQDQMTGRLYKLALQDALNAARSGARGVSAREFAAYFVLDTIKARLTMVQAANVTMVGNHATIPLGRLSPADQRRMAAPDRRLVPGGDAESRVIGDVHTHVLVDPLIDLSSTRTGATIRSSTTVLHSGVSDDVDVPSAKNDHIVVYALDSKWLHRANPNGTKNDKLDKTRNLLREALRIFGGEPL